MTLEFTKSCNNCQSQGTKKLHKVSVLTELSLIIRWGWCLAQHQLRVKLRPNVVTRHLRGLCLTHSLLNDAQTSRPHTSFEIDVAACMCENIFNLVKVYTSCCKICKGLTFFRTQCIQNTEWQLTCDISPIYMSSSQHNAGSAVNNITGTHGMNTRCQKHKLINVQFLRRHKNTPTNSIAAN